MIHPKGLFVFESKDYDGWIFGDSKRRMWTQTLPAGWEAHKEHFYNPIWQNNAHCKHLKEYIDGYAPVHSIVVFSDECEFMELNLHDDATPVIHRSEVSEVTKSICAATRSNLGQERIDEIYEQLYPFTQLSDSDKNKHAAAIRMNHQ